MVVQGGHGHFNSPPHAAGVDVGVVNDPVEGERNVGCCERFSIAPPHVGTEVECPGQPVLGTRPRLRQQWPGLIARPWDLSQFFENVPQHSRRRSVFGNDQVECERLCDGRHCQRPFVPAYGVLKLFSIELEKSYHLSIELEKSYHLRMVPVVVAIWMDPVLLRLCPSVFVW